MAVDDCGRYSLVTVVDQVPLAPSEGHYRGDLIYSPVPLFKSRKVKPLDAEAALGPVRQGLHPRTVICMDTAHTFSLDGERHSRRAEV